MVSAASTNVSSEYIPMGELNWVETIFFGVPPMVIFLVIAFGLLDEVLKGVDISGGTGEYGFDCYKNKATRSTIMRWRLFRRKIWNEQDLELLYFIIFIFHLFT